MQANNEAGACEQARCGSGRLRVLATEEAAVHSKGRTRAPPQLLDARAVGLGLGPGPGPGPGLGPGPGPGLGPGLGLGLGLGRKLCD